MKSEFANLDSLTGLYLRPALEDALSKEIRRAERYGEEFSLFIMDINHFKSINDAFGHAMGDQVLRDFARFLEKHIREVDLAFRLGGDEFVVLLPNTPNQQSEVMAQRILDLLKKVNFGEKPVLHISAGIGIACFPTDGKSQAELMEKADRRLIAAKRSGRSLSGNDQAETTSPSQLSFSRLIERDQAFETFFEFLNMLGQNRRGVFQVNSPRGGGKTRFLQELAAIGHLRGFAVLEICGNPYKKMHLFGALQAINPPIQNDLPILDWPAAILQWLKTQKNKNLLILVDDLPEVDSASLDVLQELFFQSGLEQIGILYTQSQLSAWLSESPVWLQTTLKPLSSEGVKIWLRYSLQSEPSTKLTDSVARITSGLPVRLKSAAGFLLQEGLCNNDTWDSTPLEEYLQNEPAPLTNILTPKESFVDPEMSVDALISLLENHSLVTVTGPDGIGKSRLIRQSALEIINAFPDGVWLALGVDIPYPEMIAPVLAHILQFQIQAFKDPQEQVLQHLSEKQLLLVLDGFEHLMPHIEIIGQILEKCSRVKILVACQHSLGLGGEKVVALNGLRIPPPDMQGKNVLSYNAVQLFLHHAHHPRQEFHYSENDLNSIARLCRLLNGNPLAIELAASWIGPISIRKMLVYLEEKLSAIDASEQQSSEVIFELVWSFFSKDEQRVVKGLALFNGSFSEEQAFSIVGASAFFLDALWAKAFLQGVKINRFRYHNMVRQFALGKLKKGTSEYRRLAGRFYIQYRNLINKYPAALKGSGQKAAMQELALDMPNLKIFLDMALAHKHWRLLPNLMETYYRFYEIRSWFEEGRVLFEILAQRLAHVTGARQPYGLALSCQGWFCGRQGDYQKANGLIEKGVSILRRTGDSQSLALALNQFGYINYFIDGSKAIATFEESLVLFQQLNDPAGKGFALNYTGISYYNRGEYEKGRKYIRMGLEERRLAGDESGIANSLNNLGAVTYNAGLYEEAGKLLEECLDLHQKMENQAGMALAFNNLGYVFYYLGEYERSKQYQQQSLTIASRINDRGGMADALQMTAMADLALGKLDVVENNLQRALALFQRIGLQDKYSEALANLGLLRRQQGNFCEAQSLFQQSIEAGKNELDISIVASLFAAGELAKIAIEQEDLRQAFHWLKQSFYKARRSNSFDVLIHYLIVIAQWLEKSGNIRQAAVLLQNILSQPTVPPDLRQIAQQLFDSLPEAQRINIDQPVKKESSSPLQWALDFLEDSIAPLYVKD